MLGACSGLGGMGGGIEVVRVGAGLRFGWGWKNYREE